MNQAVGVVDLKAAEPRPALEDSHAGVESVQKPSVNLDANWVRIVPFKEYTQKMAGVPDAGPMKRPDLLTTSASALYAFITIGSLSAIHYLSDKPFDKGSPYTAVLASFGASVVLMFGVPETPAGQPRNAIFGQVIGAVCGIMAKVCIAEPMETPVLALPCAIFLTLFLMQLTRTIHPPGGGTCLIMVLSKSALTWGLLLPVLMSTFVVLFWVIILNNFNSTFRYPNYWFVRWPLPEHFRDW